MILRNKDKSLLLVLAENTLKTPCEILAYGSRVNGDAHSTSDLDLVIRTQNQSPLPMEELTAFEEAIENSNIPILVQVLEWNTIPEAFKTNISHNYEVLKA